MGGKLKLFVVAGEASGDQLAAGVIKALKQLHPNLDVRGIGGALCSEQGLESLFPLSDFAVMGIVEVVRHIPRLKNRMKAICQEVLKWQPDIFLTVDSPGLALRLHNQLRNSDKRQFKQAHMVAPTVWVWKPWRAKQMAGYLDHLIVNLPFEPPYFTVHNLPTTYVGHPVTELMPLAQEATIQALLPEHAAQKTHLLVAPGSRVNEVQRLLPQFLNVCKRLRADNPDLHLLVPTVETVKPLVIELMDQSGLPYTLVEGQAARWSAFKFADLAIVASGTIALELGILGTPTIVAYTMSPITFWIIRTFTSAEYASLINIISDSHVQPELIQHQFTAEALLTEAKQFLDDPQSRARYTEQAKQVGRQLSCPEPDLIPSQMAANAISRLLATQNKP